MEELMLFKYLQKIKWVNRRDYLAMITQNLVKINWKIVENINDTIKIGDSIKIDLWKQGIFEEKITRFPTTKPVMILFNKPKWYVVSKEDKHNKIIYELLPKSWKKDFFYVWRLDKDSHWLLLLTNDPTLVDYYESPKSSIFKIYEVKIDSMFKSRDILKLTKWIPVNDEWTLMTVSDIENKIVFDYLRFHTVSTIEVKDKKATLKVILKEWKKRHIRRALSALWYKILDLKRVRFGKYQLWNIKPWKYMTAKILK